MESLTKPKVTDDQLAAIALRHLGAKSTAVQELTGGWFNAAYMLTQPDGTEYVLKVAPSPSVRVLRYETNILEVEVETMRLVTARTDIPIPAIAAYDRTGDLVDCEYFLMARLPGRPFNEAKESMAPQDQHEVYKQVGKYLQELSGLTYETFGLFNRPVYNTWREAFLSMFNDLRQDGLDLEVPLPDGAFECAEPLLHSLDVVTTPSLVHWDLWEGNVFVEGTKVTGLIDFERSLWGDALMEQNFWNVQAGTVEGYGTDILNAPLAKERRMLYDLYFFLVMVIESKFRGFTPEHEAWPRGMLDDLLKRIRELS